MPEPDAAHPNRCLLDCCFLEAGLVALALPTDFNRIGSTPCASRQQLQTVDPFQTEDHGIRSLPQVYLSTGGFHSCFTWRDALFFPRVRTPCGHGARSSLKEGKYSQMVEKRTKTTQPTKNKSQPQPKGRVSTILQSFLCARVKQVRR